MGYLWALLSIVLVSGAQLAMKQAMLRLPSPAGLFDFISTLMIFAPGTLLLLSGISGYAISMACWYLALKHLPLSKAYALLSLSYILVWAAAIWLPGWHEPFSMSALAGVIAIIGGVLLICLPSRK